MGHRRSERIGQDDPPVDVGLELWPTAGTVDVLGGRYGRINSREHRQRIGSAGSAIEASLRPDLTPVTIVMTARNAATEPWWHVYSERSIAGEPATSYPDSAWSASPIMRIRRCPPASGGGRRSPGH